MVAIAAAGETVQVTHRNRIVAELSPPHRPEQSLSREEFRAKEIREGRLTSGKIRMGRRHIARPDGI